MVQHPSVLLNQLIMNKGFEMLKTPLYKRFYGSLALAICLLQSASYANASADQAELRNIAQQGAPAVQRMAEEGNAKAQLVLGRGFQDGKGVEQNFKQAAVWYRKSADQGNAEAMYNLAHLYTKGAGVAQDDQLALAWYRKAAEQGHPGAQATLGVFYGAGQGVRQDDSQAYAWFSVASANGLEPAIKFRDAAAEKLTPQQLESAQKLAGEYFEKYSDHK
jgi:TPR repeat protein